MRAAHLLFVVFAPSAVACVREGAPPVAPVEAADIGDAGPTSALVIVPPTATPHDQCSARLRAQTIQTNPGCTLDERISHGNGTLLYPCAGDGVVEAIFGEHRFVGKLSDKTMSLTLTTELDWEDGCHWETKQALRGTWSRDSKQSPRLVWSYTERPVSGTGCYGSCIAKADLDVDEMVARFRERADDTSDPLHANLARGTTPHLSQSK